MDAEMIILCDGVVIPQSKKEIDGGVAIAGGHILRIGARGLSGSGYGGGGIP